MYKPVDVIEVRIWGQRAGAVARDPKLNFYVFRYEPKFLKTGVELAPLTMPLAQAREPFVFPSLPELTYKRLPALLADALPDDFGNALIDAWMATQGVERDSITTLDRLAYMGRRGMGALEFKPGTGPNAKKSTALVLSDLIEEARRAVHGKLGSDDMARAALAQIISVGTSAGGARAKAVVAWNPKTKAIRAGQFDVEDGFEHWLLKFDGMGKDRALGDSQEYGRIEYAYYKMATAAGIDMSPCRLLEENGRAHFMTKRFDRDGNRKHHMQTLCAMAHLDYKQTASHDYNQLFQAITKLDLGYKALEEAFRRMAFNVIAANCDDHTKNTAFLMQPDGSWSLAPAYDVTHAYSPTSIWVSQHLMAVNGKFSDITRADLMAVADRFGIERAGVAISAVRDAIASWPEFASEAGLDAQLADLIAGDFTVL